ncbi:MAG: chorismate mutase [Candidatus Woesearchaeota archaeon]
MKSIEELREEIDRVDKEIINAIAKRIALIPLVAEAKKKNNIPRYVPEREESLLKAKKEIAKSKKINPELIECIFKRLIEESHNIERKIMGK